MITYNREVLPQANDGNLKFRVEEYRGRRICAAGGRMFRKGIQIVAYDETTGKRKQVFRTENGTPTACYKLAEFGCHYKTGMKKSDEDKWDETWSEALRILSIWLNTGKPFNNAPKPADEEDKEELGDIAPTSSSVY